MVNVKSHKLIWTGWLLISVTGASLFAYSRSSSVEVRRKYMRERALRAREEEKAKIESAAV